MFSAFRCRNVCARLVLEFWTSDGGQDLAEYALLALFIGLAGFAVWGGIANQIGLNYSAYQDNLPVLWEPGPP